MAPEQGLIDNPTKHSLLIASFEDHPDVLSNSITPFLQKAYTKSSQLRNKKEKKEMCLENLL